MYFMHMRAYFSYGILSQNLIGPVCAVMSKMLALGMPLTEVVRAATATPARVIGWADRIGAINRPLETMHD